MTEYTRPIILPCPKKIIRSHKNLSYKTKKEKIQRNRFGQKINFGSGEDKNNKLNIKRKLLNNYTFKLKRNPIKKYKKRSV